MRHDVPMTTTGERAAHAQRAMNEQAVASRSEPVLERGFLLFIASSLVLILVFLPFAARLDATNARKGPMYSDLTLMAWLQYMNLREQGTVVPLKLVDGERVIVGGRQYRPAQGVTVVVRRQGDGFCVHAKNQYGDATKWHCHDLADPPETVELSTTQN
jgi:hypothetical protein